MPAGRDRSRPPAADGQVGEAGGAGRALTEPQPYGNTGEDELILYERLVVKNDESIESSLSRQVMEPESRYYGGTVDPGTGIAWVNHTSGTPSEMCNWGTALVSPDSAYYRNEALLQRLRLAAEFVLRAQHDDGSISPGWTNYHSPPDTAFVVVGYSQLYELLEQAQWAPLQPVLDSMKRFLERALPALVTGGCHTPNHRWVLCAALGWLHRLLGSEDAVRRADEWLAEGMDITPDGEWTERSNGIYSAVSDIMLIYAARLLGRPELLEPVRLNLRMMVYLVHPSGEIVTDYSGRQDLGHFHDLSPYYLPYAMLALEDRDPLLAGMAELAGAALDGPGVASVNVLVRMLLEPELRGPFGAAEGDAAAIVPTRYEKVLNGEFLRGGYLREMEGAGHHGRIFHSRLHTDFGAPVARIRDGGTSVTLMTETPSFFALRHGAARLLAVQLSSYFSPGYVPMQEMALAEGGGYRLSAEQRKGYYGPVRGEQLPASAGSKISPWYLLPHHARELTHEQAFRVGVEARSAEEGSVWTLHLSADEPQDVMTQLSFVFGGEGELVSGERLEAGPDRWLWSGGTLRYECGGDWIELEGGELSHLSKSVRDANLPSGCTVVSVNLMTPLDKRITIRLSPNVSGGLAEQLAQ